MSDFLDKLTSYNLFNYLVPGVVFCALADRFTGYELVYDDIVVGIFFYYFVGMVISRIGSVVVEPIVKWFVEFAPYQEFVEASRADVKLEVLSETNNTYRTITALFLVLSLFVSAASALPSYPRLEATTPAILAVALLALFFVAYAKQSKYVVKRIKANLGTKQG